MANPKIITQVLGSVSDAAQFPTLIEGLTGCSYYAYIYHDKDEGKNRHLHFVAQDRHSLSQWSNILGIPENMICFVRNFRSANRYLIHLDDTEKFLYNKSDVFTNKPIRFNSYLEDNSEVSPKALCDDLLKVREGVISRDDFLKKYEYYLSKQSFYSQYRIYQDLLKWS